MPKSNTKTAFRQSGEHLRQIRAAKGFSIDTLAVLSGIDAEIITAMEAGNFDFYFSTLFELAETLNVNFLSILVDPAAFGS